MKARQDDWSELMRAAIHGDQAAYRKLLEDLTGPLRALVRKGLARAGRPTDEAEDIVQEILLALHLKRHTWDSAAPLGPWVYAIARNKLIDALRRRGNRVFVPIEDFEASLASNEPSPDMIAPDVDPHLSALPSRQRAVVRAVAVEGASIRETAAKLEISEGAVRVALHRGLSELSARFKESAS